MPLPVLPLEVWLEILEAACLMDMKVPIVLSEATRELRSISRFHWFHSVKITDEEQLLAFERRFSSAPQGIRKITHLLVVLPSLLENASNEDEDEADDATDSLYTPSSTDSDDEEMELDEASFSDSEDELEYGDISPEEALELSNEDKSLPHLIDYTQTLPSFRILPSVRFYWLDPLHSSDVGGQDLSRLDHLASYRVRTMDRELEVYAALRRILEGASTSLKLFSLHWEPHCDFNIDALFPVLPNLRRLAIFRQRLTDIYAVHTVLQQKFAPFPTLFPSLLEFDINHIRKPHWGGTCLEALKSCISLRSVSLHCKLVQAMLEMGLLSPPSGFLPTSVRTLRVNCACGWDPTLCTIDVTKPPQGLNFFKLPRALAMGELEGEWEERRWLY